MFKKKKTTKKKKRKSRLPFVNLKSFSALVSFLDTERIAEGETDP